MFLSIYLLWDWAAQWLGFMTGPSDEGCMSTWVTSQSFPSVSWQHGQSTVWNTLCLISGHQCLLFASPMLEIACMTSLLSLPVPSNSCSLFVLSFIYSNHIELLSVPREPHGLSPFPFPDLAHNISLPGILFTFFFFFLPLSPTAWLPFLPWPTGYLSFRYYLPHLSSPFLSTVSLDEMFSYATSSTCYFLQTSHYCVYFNCLYSSLDCEPHECRGLCLLLHQHIADACHI